ncbi:MAG: sulfotransferase [Verrucomicrobia bacterium]|nr:sulfotransferase [Verrucomicrobiota bacterium]
MKSEWRHVFIVGSPRSGTSWLQMMLASHPDVVSSVETTMYSAYISPCFSAWRREQEAIETRRWVKGLPHLMSKQQFKTALNPLLMTAYEAIAAKRPTARTILEKAPENIFQISIIREFIPTARFVHIIRDGRDVVCSMRNVKRRVGHQTQDIERGARLWRQSIEAARSALSNDPEYIEVRYETLLADPCSEMHNVFEFCALPITSGQIAAICDQHTFEKMSHDLPTADPDKSVKGNAGNYHKGCAGTWESEMSDMDRHCFCLEAGELLNGLGYADKDWLAQYELRPGSRPTQRALRFLTARLYFLAGLMLGSATANRLLIQHQSTRASRKLEDRMQ